MKRAWAWVDPSAIPARAERRAPRSWPFGGSVMDETRHPLRTLRGAISGMSCLYCDVLIERKLKGIPAVIGAICWAVLMMFSTAASAEADAARGQRVFNACAPCHSLEPNRNMTGPSLAHLWGRQ